MSLIHKHPHTRQYIKIKFLFHWFCLENLTLGGGGGVESFKTLSFNVKSLSFKTTIINLNDSKTIN